MTFEEYNNMFKFRVLQNKDTGEIVYSHNDVYDVHVWENITEEFVNRHSCKKPI